MVLFRQLSLAVNRHNNLFTNQINRRDRQYNNDIFENCTNIPSPNLLAPDFQYLDMALTYAKYFLTDITETVNNSVQSAKT